MALNLIGAALPRTGTMSLKKALEMLGFGPCYHMHELFLHPQHLPIWENALEKKFGGLSTIFQHYTAILDTPGCLLWREFSRLYPDAKVLLLERDPKDWYRSFADTVYPMLSGKTADNDPILEFARRQFLDGFLKGRFADREFAVKEISRYYKEVRENIPSERLLVYRIDDGWGPSCDFLGVPVPKFRFPIKNSRREFINRQRRTADG